MGMTRVVRIVALTGAVAINMAACGADGGPATDESAAPKETFVTDVTFGTGGKAGVYFPLGTEYAALFERHIEGVTVEAIETGASVDNLTRISQGEMQLGLTQNDTANEAVTGRGEFEGTVVGNIGWLGQLYPEAVQVITLESSDLEGIQDLAGKRVSVGPAGSGTNIVAQVILGDFGIKEGDYIAFEESFGDARDKLQNGDIDASIEIMGVPAASVKELAATHDVRLLPIQPAMASAIAAASGFEQYVISPEAYPFLDEGVTTVSVFASVVGSTTQVSPELGYEITRLLYEHADDITIDQGVLINLDDALLGRGDIPLHPGARRYFEEQGLL